MPIDHLVYREAAKALIAAGRVDDVAALLAVNDSATALCVTWKILHEVPADKEVIAFLNDLAARMKVRQAVAMEQYFTAGSATKH